MVQPPCTEPKFDNEIVRVTTSKVPLVETATKSFGKFIVISGWDKSLIVANKKNFDALKEIRMKFLQAMF